jgi:hypothetical protein
LPALSHLFIYREKIGKLYGTSGLVNGVQNLTVSNNLFSDENGLRKNKNQQNLACPAVAFLPLSLKRWSLAKGGGKPCLKKLDPVCPCVSVANLIDAIN